MPKDTIELIERDFNASGEDIDIDAYEALHLRILIQIAYQLRVIAQKGVG